MDEYLALIANKCLVTRNNSDWDGYVFSKILQNTDFFPERKHNTIDKEF